MRRFTHVLTLAVALTSALAQGASACPNCKEAVAAQPHEAAAMAQGFNWSVLFMVSMPFLLLGTGSMMMARAVKRGQLPDF